MSKSLVAAAIFVGMFSIAQAQSPKSMPDMEMQKMMASPNDTNSTTGFKSAMMRMMQRMPSFTGDPDVDFMKQMLGHHQAAIDMAKIVLANGRDADTKRLATDIISAQEKEIVTIDNWLKKHGS